MSKQVIIVGGVVGGASAAARLRRLDENAEIVLFERGKYISFANCALRNKLDELPTDKTINIYCAVGIRSYIAARILGKKGFDAKNLSGGYSTYLARTSEKLLEGKSAQQLRDEFCTGF